MDTRCGGWDVNEKLNEIMRGGGDNLMQNSTDYTTTVADADYALSPWRLEPRESFLAPNCYSFALLLFSEVGGWKWME